MSRKTGLLVLSLLSIAVVGLALVNFMARPAPQQTDPTEVSTVLDYGEGFAVLFVPEQAVVETLRVQRARGYDCTGLGTRVGAGGSYGFYWSCRNGFIPAQEDTKE